MENINSVEREATSRVVKDLAKLILIPGYLVKYLRDGYKKERASSSYRARSGDNLVKGLTYASAVGVGACQAGLYYTQVLEPLYRLLAN